MLRAYTSASLQAGLLYASLSPGLLSHREGVAYTKAPYNLFNTMVKGKGHSVLDTNITRMLNNPDLNPNPYHNPNPTNKFLRLVLFVSFSAPPP